MDFSEGMNQLSQLCKGKDWFFDISTDTSGNYVVYVKFMNMETMTLIPDMMAGKRVLVHFSAAKLATRDQFTDRPNRSSPSEPLDVVSEVVGSMEEERSLRHLSQELEDLEKICGSNILQDIFYEIHDDKNAVTNLSAKFPEVRQRMEKLYKDYGFDVVYEELDG